VPDEKLKDQLEEFQRELAAAAENDEDLNKDEVTPEVDPTPTDDDKPEDKTDDESGQKADDATAVDDDSDKPADEGKPDQDPDAPEDKTLTTLPDDKEAFGELAGQKVTAEQLIESGYLTKLVTWGHQGRHMVQRGQEDLSEAKALRELLEKRFAQQDEAAMAAAEAAKPVVTEEAYAAALVERFKPDFERVINEGGMEKEFFADFPKVAAHIENRFQSGSELLTGLIKTVDELRQMVLPRAERDTLSEAETLFNGKVAELSKTGGLFEKLEDAEAASGFKDWVTSEESGLRLLEKDVADISQQDLQSAWLLYVHSHPEIMKAKEETSTDSHLAGGGAGTTTSSKSKSAKPTDDLGTFIGELAAANAESWEDD
jgi:hypothetical protein